jgi:very-short-patch-repair endonuclease
VKHFLFSPEGQAYLLDHYVRQGESTHAIAGALGTYANMVCRALAAHGIALRDKAQAQRLAIASGRHSHPTRGRRHSQATKDKIGEAVSRSWEGGGRAGRAEQARLRWLAMADEDREHLRLLAVEGLRRAAGEGSRLERYLAAGLRARGYRVEVRAFAAGWMVDVLLPRRKVAVQVDGPGHHLPVWGQARLARVVREDAACTAGLVAAGYAVVRVKNLVRNLSEVQERRLLTKLLSVLQSGHESVLEMEV